MRLDALQSLLKMSCVLDGEEASWWLRVLAPVPKLTEETLLSFYAFIPYGERSSECQRQSD